MRTTLLAALLLAGSVARAAGAVETTIASRATAQTPIPALAPALAHPDAVSSATADERAAALARGAETLAAQAAESPLSLEQRQALRRSAEAAPTPESREALSKAYGRAERIVESETREWRPRDAGAVAKGMVGRMARWGAVAAPLAAANAAIEHAVVRRAGFLQLGLDGGTVYDGVELPARYQAAFPELPHDSVHLFWSSAEGWLTPVVHHIDDWHAPALMVALIPLLAAVRGSIEPWSAGANGAKRLARRLFSFGAPAMATGLLLQLFDIGRLGGVFDWLHLTERAYVSPGDLFLFAGHLALAAALIESVHGLLGEAIAKRRAARKKS